MEHRQPYFAYTAPSESEPEKIEIISTSEEAARDFKKQILALIIKESLFQYREKTNDRFDNILDLDSFINSDRGNGIDVLVEDISQLFDSPYISPRLLAKIDEQVFFNEIDIPIVDSLTGLEVWGTPQDEQSFEVSITEETPFMTFGDLPEGLSVPQKNQINSWALQFQPVKITGESTNSLMWHTSYGHLDTAGKYTPIMTMLNRSHPSQHPNT